MKITIAIYCLIKIIIAVLQHFNTNVSNKLKNSKVDEERPGKRERDLKCQSVKSVIAKMLLKKIYIGM